MKHDYLSLISLVDHLHRQFLDLVSTELERIQIQDINSVQAILLFNIGEADMTVGELTLRGCYLGSNVSYNVKKLVETGYLLQRRAPDDRRTVRVRLSPKGLALCATLDAMHGRHLATLAEWAIEPGMVGDALTTLRRFDRFWSRMVEQGQLPILAHRAA
jgi:DNA-binding MarR family transcriptional regulator